MSNDNPYSHPLINQSKILALPKKYKDKDGNLDPKKVRFLADATKTKTVNFKPVKFKSVKDEVKDFILFVGYRGYLDNKGYPIIDLSYTPKYIERDMQGNIVKTITITKHIEIILRKQGFEVIREYHHPYNPGTAHPPPIDEKGNELGILPHEVEGFKKIRKYLRTGIMFKWPRGFGKTYLATWFIEWSMLRLGYPWLYLSETAIMNDVAYWIWQWAKKQNIIAHADKGDKQNTYTQFELKNGAVLRIFRYMDEAPTGQHGWYLALDDIIKKGWSDRPSDNDRSKRQWNYVHNYIRRKGVMIFGTRKFQGDTIEHLEVVVPKIHIEVKTPYVMKGEFPDWEIEYDANDMELLWVPELYTHEALEEKKISIAEESDEDPIIAWMTEMMQDPRPSAGGLCSPDDIDYARRPEFHENVQMVGIGVDLSWEDEKPTSDMCAVISMVMHQIEIEKVWYKRFIAVRSDVYRMPLYDTERDGVLHKGVFTIIGEHVAFLRRYYPHIPLIIAIERNSGGTIIIKVALRENFEWVGYIIPDRKEAVKIPTKGNTNIPLGITHKKNKISRVYGELHNSIRYVDEHLGHELQFEWALEGTTLITQLVGFPKLRHDDGPDATGMIKDELNARYKPKAPPRMPREAAKMQKQLEKYGKEYQERAQPWMADVKRLKHQQRRLSKKV